MIFKTKKSKEEIMQSIKKNTQKYSFSNLYLKNAFLSEILNDSNIYLYYTGTLSSMSFFCYKVYICEDKNVVILHGQAEMPRDFKIAVLIMSIIFTIVWLFFCLSINLYFIFIPLFIFIGTKIRKVVNINMQNAQEIKIIETFIEENILSIKKEKVSEL